MFTGYAPPLPANASHIWRWINRFQEETGVDFVFGTRRQQEPLQWASRHGIHLTRVRDEALAA